MTRIGLKKIMASAVIALAAGAALQIPHGSKDAGADSIDTPTFDMLRAEIFGGHYARILGMNEQLPEGEKLSSGRDAADMVLIRVRLRDLADHIPQERISDSRSEGREMVASGGWGTEAVRSYARGVIDADEGIRETWGRVVAGLSQLGASADWSAALATHAVAAGAWQGSFGEVLPPEITVPDGDLSVGQHLIHAEGIAASEIRIRPLVAAWPEQILSREGSASLIAPPDALRF